MERYYGIPKKGALFASILAFLLVASIFAVNIDTADAAPENYKTFSYISAIPNPVGVNQQLVVTFRLDKTPPTAGGGTTGDRWQNMNVVITRPDGTTETKGPYSSDAVGGAWFYYTPTTTGEYKFQMTFAGQWINASASVGMFGASPAYQRWY